MFSWPVTGTVSSTLSGTLPAVSQNSPGRFSSETLIPRRVSGQDSGGSEAEVEARRRPCLRSGRF